MCGPNAEAIYCHLHPTPGYSVAYNYAYNSTSGFSDSALRYKIWYATNHQTPPGAWLGWYWTTNAIINYSTGLLNHHNKYQVTYDYDCYVNWTTHGPNSAHPQALGSPCPGGGIDGVQSVTESIDAEIDYDTVPWHRVRTYSHSYIDRQNTWYKGDGNIGDIYYDLWSVVAHELGHQQGLGDLGETDGYCPDDYGQGVGRATMCPVNRGMHMQRTPEFTEDVNSIDVMY